MATIRKSSPNLSRRQTPNLSRRQIMTLAASALAVTSLAPRAAFATPDDVAKYVASLGLGTAKAGKVTIGAPEIAENGNTVPITISVDSPMTEQDYVKKIVMVADGNPLPGVANFDLTPANGAAHVEFRIRLAQTQNITAIAQMSDGSTWSASRAVKVTIGGCGG